MNGGHILLMDLHATRMRLEDARENQRLMKVAYESAEKRVGMLAAQLVTLERQAQEYGESQT